MLDTRTDKPVWDNGSDDGGEEGQSAGDGDGDGAADAAGEAAAAKRRRVIRQCERQSAFAKKMTSIGHGRATMLKLGPERIGHLSNGVLQEWDLSAAGVEHDGTDRFVRMIDVEEELQQWPADEVLDWHENTWMDDCGRAEVSAGVRASAVRQVEVVTPTSVGYLPCGKMLFAHANEGTHGCYGRIPVMDGELRECGALVGHVHREVEVVRRPAYEDGSKAITSDPCCVKVWDMRTAQPIMTMQENNRGAGPIGAGGAQFVWSQLDAGLGLRVWDLRAGGRPLGHHRHYGRQQTLLRRQP